MARKLIVEIIGDSSSLEKSFKQSANGANKFEKSLNQTVRGTAAASGAFKSVGRSIAFASGGFLAAASITDLIGSSIRQAQEAAVAQGQLAAQFKASGQNLADFQAQIDSTVSKLSVLAGIEDDQVKAAFTLAFRATQDVNEGLRITSIAADVAKGRHIELAQATIALNKAFAGQTTALKRLGIVVPANLSGMQALEFVARRFAGQAAAGTTSTERFAAAFANMKEAIGTALLPVFNKYVNKLAEWLGNAENQKKVQQDVTTIVNDTAAAFEALAAAIEKTNSAIQFLRGLPLGKKGLLDLPGGRQGLLELLGLRGGGGSNTGDFARGVRNTGGGGDFISQTVRPFRESGAFQAATGTGSLGFNARLLKLQIAFAKAELTASARDDRAVLVQTAALVKQRISRVKNLKDRTALYQQLASIQNQIAAIDQTQQQNEEQARQKIKDARQKALDAAKRRADAEKAQNAKEVALLKSREQKLKDQIKAIQGRFKDQLDAARQGIGDLFAGPIKGDASEAARRTLGLTTAPTGIGALTSTLRAQTSQAAQFQKDINRLVKRGAPNELIKELRAAGVAGAGTQAHTLATATTAGLKAFLAEFGKREKLALTTTQTIMRSQTVTLNADKVRLENVKQEITIHNHTHLDGQKIASNTSKWQARAHKRTAAQTSGRIAGLGPVVG